ncbi:hypothetical protein Cagg_0407 [Chloroflexus aggregans DSM 9485]|uniref:Uncharacterized protein n=1 Tax=Chloroflexus aggregans (strain MD-66 / DSM 9485) TaxID=326427 RepID=B8G3G9_CHLAD|nr:hypothetical protein Cagg_0407 [Chloroflexus aggregans DSM 9485]
MGELPSGHPCLRNDKRARDGRCTRVRFVCPTYGQFAHSTVSISKPLSFRASRASFPIPPDLSSGARNLTRPPVLSSGARNLTRPPPVLSSVARHLPRPPVLSSGVSKLPRPPCPFERREKSSPFSLSFRAARASLTRPRQRKTSVTLRSDISSPNRERALNGARS